MRRKSWNRDKMYFEGRVGDMMASVCTRLCAPKPGCGAAAGLRKHRRAAAARLTRCAQLALEYVAQLDDPLPPELLTRCGRPKRTLCGPSMPRGTRMPPAAV